MTIPPDDLETRLAALADGQGDRPALVAPSRDAATFADLARGMARVKARLSG